MALTDLPLDQLERFRPEVAEPADFDAFWTETLGEARAAGGSWSLEPAATAISEFVVEDLTFPGYGGEPIRAWATRPRREGRLPVVVEFLGYNGGRGLPGERLQWPAAGYLHVLMDTRGQGSGWGSGGDTPDPHGSGPAVAGFMTRGISDPRTYFYRRVHTDAVRLLDAVRELPFADAGRIAVAGASQGGAIAIAAAALSPEVRAVMPDVPFLAHFRRSIERTPLAPFTEITQYLSIHRDETEAVHRTLAYFDTVNFARRVTAPALFSVALMDEVVLPSTVYAAFNHLPAGDREIVVYPYNAHEGGQLHQWARQAEWLPVRLV
ncbi:MAG: acetylxylan esterase [Pseudolysinimonas sp.]